MSVTKPISALLLCCLATLVGAQLNAVNDATLLYTQPLQEGTYVACCALPSNASRVACVNRPPSGSPRLELLDVGSSAAVSSSIVASKDLANWRVETMSCSRDSITVGGSRDGKARSETFAADSTLSTGLALQLSTEGLFQTSAATNLVTFVATGVQGAPQNTSVFAYNTLTKSFLSAPDDDRQYYSSAFASETEVWAFGTFGSTYDDLFAQRFINASSASSTTFRYDGFGGRPNAAYHAAGDAFYVVGRGGTDALASSTSASVPIRRILRSSGAVDPAFRTQLTGPLMMQMRVTSIVIVDNVIFPSGLIQSATQPEIMHGGWDTSTGDASSIFPFSGVTGKASTSISVGANANYVYTAGAVGDVRVSVVTRLQLKVVPEPTQSPTSAPTVASSASSATPAALAIASLALLLAF